MNTGRNQPCPCGSGRKFKQCCGAGQPRPAPSPFDGDRRWVNEHVLRGGDFFFYGPLYEEMSSLPPEVFWKELRNVAERYLSLREDRTAAFHKIVDDLLTALGERDRRYGYPPPFCHKGCCACCQELVYCTSEEAELILKYCREQAIEIDYDKIRRQLRYIEVDELGDHTGVSTWNDQAAEDQNCIFLNPCDHACLIWQVRPFVCRVHLAEATDRHCKPHNGVTDPEVRGINYPEWSYILTAIFTLHRDSIKKSLGRLLLDLHHQANLTQRENR